MTGSRWWGELTGYDHREHQQYQLERDRGIDHTKSWDARMREVGALIKHGKPRLTQMEGTTLTFEIGGGTLDETETVTYHHNTGELSCTCLKEGCPHVLRVKFAALDHLIGERVPLPKVSLGCAVPVVHVPPGPVSPVEIHIEPSP